MRTLSPLAAGVASLAVSLAGCGSSESGYAVIGDRSRPFQGQVLTTPTIEMRDIGFSPKEVRVAAGGTVTWVNTDGVDHTVTAGDDLFNRFDSEEIEPGETYRRKLSEPGDIAYMCTVHANMEGKLRVE